MNVVANVSFVWLTEYADHHSTTQYVVRAKQAQILVSIIHSSNLSLSPLFPNPVSSLGEHH